MKRGTTPTLEIKLELNATNVTDVYFTFKEKVEDSDNYLLQKNYPEDATYDDENEVFLLPLTQEDTLKLTDTFFLEAEVVLGGKSVIKSDIGKEIMQPTLYTEVIEGNESNGESDVISLSFTDYVEGGGSGGTTNYNELSNKPKFNGIEWVGNKTDSDMGIATKGELQTKADKSDTYTKEETNTLLGGKQDNVSGGSGIKIENDEISVDKGSFLTFVNNTLSVDVRELAENFYFRGFLANTTYGNALASKTYVDNLISGRLKRLVVETLPTQDIDTNTIYMILKSVPTTNNIYDEYMYINNAWELIGSTEVDLSNYYTKTESDNRYSLQTNTYTKNEVNNIAIQKAFRNYSGARYNMAQIESNAVALNVADYDTLKITATTMTTSNSYKLDNGTQQTFARADLPLTIDVSSASKFYAWSGFSGEYLTYDLTNTDFDYATTTDLSSKQDTIDSSHKLSADNVDDTNSSNKFVSANEKQTWNAKADTSDIPTDVSELNNDSGYQTSSDVALAIIDKEDKTTISTDTTSTTVSLTLADNHEYRYTQDLTSLTLTMPNGDFISSIVFASGSTPTSMTYDSSIKWSGNDVTSNAFVPQANMEYEIVFWYNGLSVNAVVRGVA